MIFLDKSRLLLVIYKSRLVLVILRTKLERVYCSRSPGGGSTSILDQSETCPPLGSFPFSAKIPEQASRNHTVFLHL